MNTVIDTFRDHLFRLVESMSPAGVQFVIQVAALVIIPTALCGATYLLSFRTAAVTQSAPKPNQGLQVCMFIIGLLTALCLPVERIEIFEPLARLWVMTLCLLMASMLPALLGYLIVPDAQAQRNTIRNIYIVIFVLSAWQILRGVFQ
jgi:hypothetical protein